MAQLPNLTQSPQHGQTTIIEENAYGVILSDFDELAALSSTWQEIAEKNARKERRLQLMGDVACSILLLLLFTSPAWLPSLIARFNG